MLTHFGKILRKIRIDHSELLKDMAVFLDVTPSFLSAVETGRKNAPSGWSTKIADRYGLTSEQKIELEEAERESVTSIKVDIRNAEHSQRSAALVFARHFDEMDTETANRIIRMLQSGSKEG